MKPPQLEVTFDQPDPFTLKVKETQDGDRIAREKAQREADRAASDSQQPSLI